ncbi:tRNA sulfurtransferase [Nanoarchaeota archaeon]
MKGILLLSGGIDSPVAAKLMQEQGMELVAVHFHTEPFTGPESTEKCKVLAKMLNMQLYIVPLGEQSSELVKKCNHRYYYVLTRRLMWRIAEKIAEKEKCKVLVTGENLGQVSSQTLENLTITDQSVKMPILRPLLTNDKLETIRLAEEYGTMELSKGPEVCCALGPRNPITRGHLDKVLAEELQVDVQAMVQKALDEMDKL